MRFSFKHKILNIILALMILSVCYWAIHYFVLKRKMLKLNDINYSEARQKRTAILKKIKKNVKIVKSDDLFPDRIDDLSDSYFKKELVIGGVKETDANKFFYNVGAVIDDKDGNIYISQIYDGTITKLNSRGEYLLTFGNKGKGPGELIFPSFMAFDANNALCVLDHMTQRITRFSKEGKYISSIKIPISHTPSGFAIDQFNNFYVSIYDKNTNTVIQKYNSKGKQINILGNAISFTNDKLISRMLKSNWAVGSLAFYNNVLCFSQRNPYEIMIYENDSLRKIIFRSNNFMHPPDINFSALKVSVRMPVFSYFLGFMNDKIINVIFVPKDTPSNSEMIFDIFNFDGILLKSFRIKKYLWVTHLNKNGQFYGILKNEDGVEKVIKFSLNLNRIIHN